MQSARPAAAPSPVELAFSSSCFLHATLVEQTFLSVFLRFLLSLTSILFSSQKPTGRNAHPTVRPQHASAKIHAVCAPVLLQAGGVRSPARIANNFPHPCQRLHRQFRRLRLLPGAASPLPPQPDQSLRYSPTRKMRRPAPGNGIRECCSVRPRRGRGVCGTPRPSHPQHVWNRAAPRSPRLA